MAVLIVQSMAFLYFPFGEFIYLVLITSTGEATTVVQNPAATAAEKWQGIIII